MNSSAKMIWISMISIRSPINLNLSIRHHRIRPMPILIHFFCRHPCQQHWPNPPWTTQSVNQSTSFFHVSFDLRSLGRRQPSSAKIAHTRLSKKARKAGAAAASLTKVSACLPFIHWISTSVVVAVVLAICSGRDERCEILGPSTKE